jgi:hypothetical protein
VRIHLAAEHAPELELAHATLKACDLALDLLSRRLIVFSLGELQQLARVTDRGQRRIQILELTGKLRTLAAQGLGTLRSTPNRRLLELAADFL